jgi:hypothetical protein
MRKSARLSLVFEHGVEALILDSHRLRLSAPYWDEEFGTAGDFVSKYGLRPLCVVYQNPYGPRFHTFYGAGGVRVEAGNLRDIQFSLSPPAFNAFRQMWTWTDAAAYHLGHIVDSYVDGLTLPSLETALGSGYVPAEVSEACPAYRWLRRLPFERIYLVTGGEYSEGVYYNAVAFLLAVKRSLNALALLLNCCDWSRGRGYPASFRKVVGRIDRGDDAMPDPLQSLFRAEANAWALESIRFRDCIEHFAAVSDTMPMGLGGFTVSIEGAVVGLHAWFPDKPTERVEDFTYREGRDYMTYSVDTYSRLVSFVLKVARATVATSESS